MSNTDSLLYYDMHHFEESSSILIRGAYSGLFDASFIKDRTWKIYYTNFLVQLSYH